MRCRSPTNFMRWQHKSVQFEAPQFLSWKIPSSDQQCDTTFLSASVAEVLAEKLQTRPDSNPLGSLSKREREILQLVAEGHSSAQIAKTLSLSPKTVDTYRSRLMQKLGLKDVGGIVRFSLQHHLISLD